MTGWCFRCRCVRTMVNTEQTIKRNGRPAIKGNCEVCGCNMSKVIKLEDASAAP